MTAVNLSWLLAQTDGVRALLSDADLRTPTAADYLGIDAPLGLSEVLAGEATLEESIIRLEPAGLHLLPGGEPRENVAELLSGPGFGRVLKELRGMYDYIIIDTPPLGIFTDATLVISRADGVLVVARAERTRYSALERLLEPIPRERVLGVVLNGADERRARTTTTTTTTPPRTPRRRRNRRVVERRRTTPRRAEVCKRDRARRRRQATVAES